MGPSSCPPDLRATFFEECDELMEALLDGLQRLASGDPDADVIHTIFRAVHSIKGGAAAFGLDALVQFAHRFENVLDDLRSASRTAPPEVVDLLVRAGDQLGDLVQASQDGSPDLPPPVRAVMDALDALSGQQGAGSAPTDGAADFQPVALALPGLSLQPPDTAPALPCTLRFCPKDSFYTAGNDAAPVLRALAALGPVTTTCDLSALPDLDALDPGAAYLTWTCQFNEPVPEADIRSCFEFVEDLCDLSFAPPPTAGDPIDAAAPAERPAPPAKSAPPPPAQVTKTAPRHTVRVDLDRVETLMNLVGELVITQSVLAQHIGQSPAVTAPQTSDALDDLKRLTGDIQHSVMLIRAQPIKPLFQRMRRIVRDTAAQTGKAIALQVEGEDTEIDKTVLEHLTDPLTHMLRNAIDHGIEPGETRRAQGKPETGCIWLRAAHRSGRVVIEVEDDGQGLDRARIQASARAKGLIDETASLDQAEATALLLRPGFSTARSVSDLSGRGVGMDVVNRAVQDLGGRISLASRPGQGLKATISLPLTLAVMDGMVIRAKNQTYVIPLTAVVETVRLTPGTTADLSAGLRVTTLRGRSLRVLSLADLLTDNRDPSAAPAQGVCLLLRSDGDTRFLLQVDDIIGQRQVVIKGLPAGMGPHSFVSGATILGDGQISLILDPGGLVNGLDAPKARGLDPAA